MVGTNTLIANNQIAAAVCYVQDDTLLPREAKDLLKFRSVEIGGREKMNWVVKNKTVEFDGIIVGIQKG